MNSPANTSVEQVDLQSDNQNPQPNVGTWTASSSGSLRVTLTFVRTRDNNSSSSSLVPVADDSSLGSSKGQEDQVHEVNDMIATSRAVSPCTYLYSPPINIQQDSILSPYLCNPEPLNSLPNSTASLDNSKMPLRITKNVRTDTRPEIHSSPTSTPRQVVLDKTVPENANNEIDLIPVADDSSSPGTSLGQGDHSDQVHEDSILSRYLSNPELLNSGFTLQKSTGSLDSRRTSSCPHWSTPPNTRFIGFHATTYVLIDKTVPENANEIDQEDQDVLIITVDETDKLPMPEDDDDGSGGR